jgi:hypothetical protein
MDLQPMGKVRYLSRLAGRVAARSTVRWSSLWIFLGICLLAAVVGDAAVGLPPAQGAAAVAGMPRSAQGPVSGPTLTLIAAGTCTVTASQGGSDHYAAARDIAQSFDVASPTSGFPGALTILLGAVVFAAAGATSLARRVRRSHRPPEPEPTVRADPVPGPPTLVSVQNTGAGVTHTVRIESCPGASITRIKEGKS